ncbi:hypothetical protein FQN54_003399 [Arachnomyces sp. PD_36]|nr:hypothetical protein FQN54_003399 [Arachnomyces sp. PD_36]
MNTQELKDDLLELYNHRSSFFVRDKTSVTTDVAKWKLGPIFTERETWGYDDIDPDVFITEAAGACVVTQIDGPNPGMQGIAKIRIQIPNAPEDYPSTKPHRCSARSGFEYVNLRELTEHGCTCSPRLLDFQLFYQTSRKHPVPGGFWVFIVMERLPGRNLVNFADLPMSERDQVRLAFAKSIREFYSMRFRHDDPDRRNLVWDRENKKCYIIDLEDARQLDSDIEPRKFIPEIDFREWGIAGPEINTSRYGLDPMVPHDRKYIENPDDETLEKMAAEAAGKELLFLRFDDRAGGWVEQKR